MVSRYETFSKDEIWEISEAVDQTNTKKVRNFGLSVLTGRYKENDFYAEFATKS